MSPNILDLIAASLARAQRAGITDHRSIADMVQRDLYAAGVALIDQTPSAEIAKLERAAQLIAASQPATEAAAEKRKTALGAVEEALVWLRRIHRQ